MKRAGLVLLLLVVAVAVGYQFWVRRGAAGSAGGPGAPGSGGHAPGPPVTVKGLVGGEKMGLLKDEEVQRILQGRYGVTVEYSRAGSIDMVSGNVAGQDFLWPSSQIALEIYKQKGGKSLRS